MAKLRQGYFALSITLYTPLHNPAKTGLFEKVDTVPALYAQEKAFLAFQLEQRYTKDELLELYLNQVYFGSGAYGVESAARIFFGKSSANLSLSECALIAGLPKAPSRYSPLVNKELAKRRRNIVLKQMKDTGIITATAYTKAMTESLHLREHNKKSVNAIKAFLEGESIEWMTKYKRKKNNE